MKTIDEAKQDANDCVMPKSAYEFDRGFDAGVEFAQRWIPVEEERPTLNEKVQVKLSIQIHGEITIDVDHDKLIIDNKRTWMFDVEQQVGINVTHWRPIKLK